MTDPAHTGTMEWLDRDECLRLLGTDTIGRLAVVVGRTPTILPVNYALDGDTIIIRSDPGTKVDYGRRGPVAFEIDAFNRDDRTGWSVVVTGRLEEPAPYSAAQQRHIRSVPVEPWAGGEKAHWLRIVPNQISGRRLTAPR